MGESAGSLRQCRSQAGSYPGGHSPCRPPCPQDTFARRCRGDTSPEHVQGSKGLWYRKPEARRHTGCARKNKKHKKEKQNTKNRDRRKNTKHKKEKKKKKNKKKKEAQKKKKKKKKKS